MIYQMKERYLDMTKKIDRRRHYRIVIDCETAPCDKTLQAVRPDNMFAYDIGWAVVDKHGNVYETRSFINADIFLDEKELMQSAYYATKIPMYWDEIKSGKRVMTSLYNIREALHEDVKLYNVDEIYAHNMRFDLGALNNTLRWETKSKYRYFFPYGVMICDTLKMARQVVAETPTYKRFCEKNGYMTKSGKVRLTAEVLYRYISQNDDFVENHTGLEDVLIEKEILRYCFAKHKKMTRNLFQRG